MPVLWLPHALLPDGWAADVRLRIEGGRFAAVETGVPPQPGDLRLGPGFPGLANLHSHAF